MVLRLFLVTSMLVALVVAKSSLSSGCCNLDAKKDSPKIVSTLKMCPDGKTTDTSEKAAAKFLRWFDKKGSELINKLSKAEWNYQTDITDENEKKLIEETVRHQEFTKAAWKNATCFDWNNFKNNSLRRAFEEITFLGESALPESKYKQLTHVVSNMTSNYGTAKICGYKNRADCNLRLEPELSLLMEKSRDYDELSYIWKSWRDVAGKPVKKLFWEMKELTVEAAKLNGFKNGGEMWRHIYECCIFEENMREIWQQVKPLYENLHAYVRRKLRDNYGADKIKADGPIPAHLLGNMWAQQWNGIMDIVKPFPNKPSVDVTGMLKEKKTTVKHMVEISEEFFTSLGLKPMTKQFWNNSVFERVDGKKMVCHASAHDFHDGKDFRIKMCTVVTENDLVTIHHEMGHIQYFMQYASLPYTFREGANPGFHEAIGDVLALSVSTPSHMKKIGLLQNVADDPEGDINYLMNMGLSKVAILPFAYIIDLWRWEMFSDDVNYREVNTKWWELRLKYQGVCPPVRRDEKDFDPAAKYHISSNVPYIRYFVSHILQFQFHEALCKAAGHKGPLHKCDIYRSKEAGELFSKGMKLGKKDHWCRVLDIITAGGSKNLDAGPMMRYFDPLLKFLKKKNEETKEHVGWKIGDPLVCP